MANEERIAKKKEMIEREISYKEFLKESEGKYKFFRVKFTQLHQEILTHVREYQCKEEVMRIISSPTTNTFKLTVIEMVDNG